MAGAKDWINNEGTNEQLNELSAMEGNKELLYLQNSVQRIKALNS